MHAAMAGEPDLSDVALMSVMNTVLHFRSAKYLEDFAEKLLGEGIAAPAELLKTSKEALETKLSTHASFTFIEMADALSLRSYFEKYDRSTSTDAGPARGKKQSADRRHRSRSFDRGFRCGRRKFSGNRNNSRPSRGKGGPPHRREEKHKPALWEAVDQSNIPLVQQLLAAGKDPEEKFEGWTPLMKASEEGSVDIVKMFLEKGVDVEASNKKGRTALSFAAAPSNNGSTRRSTPTEVLRVLLQHGADTKRADVRGMTPKDHAVLMKRNDALAIFEEFGF